MPRPDAAVIDRSESSQRLQYPDQANALDSGNGSEGAIDIMCQYKYLNWPDTGAGWALSTINL